MQSFFYGIFAPPPLVTFTTDEKFISESGIFLLYGITPKNLEWAALPSTFIAYLIFVFWCLITLVSSSSSIKNIPDILTIFDKNALHYLNHPEEFIIWERWVQIILVGFIIYKTIKFIIASKHPILKPELKFILLLICVSSDALWIAAPIIRPEALSGSLFLFLIINILFTEKITLKTATFLIIVFIITFSQRLLFLFLSPFVLGSLFVHLKKQKTSFKTFFNYLIIVFFSVLAFIPFILTDTFVILKSFFGMISTKINHEEMNTFFNISYLNKFIESPFNVIITFFCVVGMWFFYKFYQIKLVSLLFILNFILLLFSSLRAAQLYDTHTFPLSIMAIILISFGIHGSMVLLRQGQKKIVLTVFGLIFILHNAWTIQQRTKTTYSQQQNIVEAIKWIKTLENDDKLLLSLEFDGLIPKNKACLLREYEANASENYRSNKLHQLLKMPQSDSISKFTIPVLAQSFGFEDEKLFETQYLIALRYIDSDSSKRFDTDYFYKNNINMSHCYVQNEALERFKNGKYHYIVSQQQMLNLTPIKSFLNGDGEKFWAYQFKDNLQRANN